jgi:hypothetical protein
MTHHSASWPPKLETPKVNEKQETTKSSWSWRIYTVFFPWFHFDQIKKGERPSSFYCWEVESLWPALCACSWGRQEECHAWLTPAAKGGGAWCWGEKEEFPNEKAQKQSKPTCALWHTNVVHTSKCTPAPHLASGQMGGCRAGGKRRGRAKPALYCLFLPASDLVRLEPVVLLLRL